MSTVRRVGRRLSVLLLALLTMGGLLDANATPAQAQTQSNWSVITWDIDPLRDNAPTQQGALNYRNLIQNIRGLATAEQRLGTGPNSNHLQETEDRPNRFIEVQVRNSNVHILSLYFQTRDMYLLGIAAGDVRYQFATNADGSPLAQAYRQFYGRAGGFRAIGYTENYNNLANRHTRENFSYTSGTMFSHLRQLADMNQGNADTRRQNFAYIIQATSEAVRFDWIRDRIYQTIRDGVSQPDPYGNRYSYLGSYGVDLTLSWADISSFVYRTLRNVAATVIIAGHTYATIYELLHGGNGRPGIGGLVASVSKKRD
ncbi:ribosome-inactivating family protein [Streptomyces chrestomyceticus]|uniref:ribosome-inactivating family protein n=1 Tax=Streptomyces chrestomyceticus TaxID=68185 RepID=UPI0033DA384B